MDHRIPKPAKSVEDAIFDMVHEVATSENDESLGTLLSLLRDTVQQLDSDAFQTIKLVLEASYRLLDSGSRGTGSPARNSESTLPTLEASLGLSGTAPAPRMVTERLGTVIDGIAGALVDAVQNYVDFAKLHTDFASMGPLIERIWNKDFALQMAHHIVELARMTGHASKMPIAGEQVNESLGKAQAKFETALTRLVEGAVIPWLLKEGSEASQSAALDLFSTLFELQINCGSFRGPIVLLAQELVSTSFFGIVLESVAPSVTAVNFACRCLRLLIHQDGAWLIFERDMELFMNELAAPIQRRNKPKALTVTPTLLSILYIRSIQGDRTFLEDPTLQDTIRMVLDAVIGLGVDGFVKASKSGDRDQEKVVRGQLAVASWLLALHARHLSLASETTFPPSVHHLVAWFARCFQALETSSEPVIVDLSWAQAVLPWIWRCGRTSPSLKTSVLVLTNVLIAGLARLLKVEFIGRGCKVTIWGELDVEWLLRPDALDWIAELLQSPDFCVPGQARHIITVLQNALDRLPVGLQMRQELQVPLVVSWNTLCSWVCETRVPFEEMSEVNDFLRTSRKLNVQQFPVPASLRLVIVRFTRRLFDLERSLHNEHSFTSIQDLHETASHLVIEANFLSLQDARPDLAAFEVVHRMACYKEPAPWKGDSQYNSRDKAQEKQKLRILGSVKEALAGFVALSVWAVVPSPNDQLSVLCYKTAPDIFRSIIAIGSVTGVAKLAEVMIETYPRRLQVANEAVKDAMEIDQGSEVRDVPLDTSNDKIFDPVKENELWLRAWHVFCSAFVSASPFPESLTVYITQMMRRLLEHLKETGSERLAAALLATPQLRFITVTALEQLHEYLAWRQQRSAVLAAQPEFEGSLRDIKFGQRYRPLFRDFLLLDEFKPRWLEEEVARIWGIKNPDEESGLPSAILAEELGLDGDRMVPLDSLRFVLPLPSI